jgi:murein DD-endopeptidase MepM/ murein hydrolase activator NlpD
MDDKVKSTKYVKPFSGNRDIICPFGQRVIDYHWGTDYKMPEGTSVYSPFDGVIHKVITEEKFRGNVLEVVCVNTGLMVRFFHLKEILVSEGQHISIASKVALSGNTGLSTEPHLHITLLPNKDSKLEEALDPELSFMQNCEEPCIYNAKDKTIKKFNSFEESLEYTLNNDDLWNDHQIDCNIQKAVFNKDISYLLKTIIWLKNDIEISRQIRQSENNNK